MAPTTTAAQARLAVRAPRRLLALRSDDALAERAAAGDEAAFEVLYERYASGVLSFCRHLVGTREEAEDAVQHAFAALHSELVRDSGTLHLRPWLYTVARNRCLSMLRARRERPDDALEPSTAGLADEVERRADLRELLADLQDLPADQRAALVLTELGDLSQAEVGAVLDTDAAKVKGLVFRARSGLVERREARATPCEAIRVELAGARRGALRRGRLRHHLRSCPECAHYLQDIRRQRRMIALLLPVVPSVGLKRGVLAAAGLGVGAGAGGVAATKAIVISAIAGSAVLAGGGAVELTGPDMERPPGPAAERPAGERERPAPTSGPDAGPPHARLPPPAGSSADGPGTGRRGEPGRARAAREPSPGARGGGQATAEGRARSGTGEGNGDGNGRSLARGRRDLSALPGRRSARTSTPDLKRGWGSPNAEQPSSRPRARPDSSDAVRPKPKRRDDTGAPKGIGKLEAVAPPTFGNSPNGR